MTKTSFARRWIAGAAVAFASLAAEQKTVLKTVTDLGLVKQ